MTNDVAKPQKTDRRKLIAEPIQQAIRLIVTEGLQMDEAAKQANVSTRTLRLALKRPHVLRFLKEEREMLMVPIHAQNPRRLSPCVPASAIDTPIAVNAGAAGAGGATAVTATGYQL